MSGLTYLDRTQILVLVSGLVLIVAILRYFFGERKRTVVAESAGGVQELKVTVKGGYTPDLIVVKQGRPVKLDFYRDETASCSEEVIFGDFGIARQLPAFKTTVIEFTPEKAGEFTFTCGMNMLRGRLVVEPADSLQRSISMTHAKTRPADPVTDVVCGMSIDRDSAAGSSQHAGAFYYFCSTSCKAKFDADPDEYAHDAAANG